MSSSDTQPALPAAAGPVPVADIDAEHLHRLVASYHRLRWIAVGVLLAVTAGVLAWLIVQNHAQDVRISAQQVLLASQSALVASQARELAVNGKAACRFDLAVAQLPPDNGPEPPPPEFIDMISAGRQAYLTRMCPGTLPAPSAETARWARIYGIPLP